VKITELRTTVIGAPWRELTFVELVTDEGLTGVGEVRVETHGRFAFADPWVAKLVDQAPTVDAADRCFAVPRRPSIGVRLDHDACRAHPPTGARLELFRESWETRRGGR
jgi:L-alanine-DL-glutamate epimerase-like enolase superfamily enzyme